MVSAVIGTLPHQVSHLYNLPCVDALFRLISVDTFVFKSLSICFHNTIEISLKMMLLRTSTIYIVIPSPAV